MNQTDIRQKIKKKQAAALRPPVKSGCGCRKKTSNLRKRIAIPSRRIYKAILNNPRFRKYSNDYVWALSSTDCFADCCNCCPDEGVPCPDCNDAVITEFSVTVSGVVNNNCSDCDALNSTFILEVADPDTPDCASFIYNRTDDCVEGNTIEGGISGGSVIVSFENGAAIPTYSGWAADHNGCCCGEHSMTNISGITDECDFSSATVTVNITCEAEICTADCSECPDGAPLQYSVTIDGDTFTLDHVTGFCEWSVSGPIDASGCSGLSGGITLTIGATTTTLSVIDIVDSADYTIATSSFDCMGNNTLTLSSNTLGCSMPASVSVSPA